MRWPIDVFHRVRGECEIIEADRRIGRDYKRERSERFAEHSKRRLSFARKTGLAGWFKHG